MLPILHIASWDIRTYGLLVGVAVFVVGVYGFQRLRRLDTPVMAIIIVGTLVILGGIGAALCGGYLARWEPLHRLGFPTQAEGTTLVWAVLGALCVALVLCPLFRIPIGRSFDRAAPACVLGLAIGRIGCFAAGCCAGLTTDSPLGMVLPGEDGVWAVRYPTQLWDAAANAGIFVVLLLVERSARGRRQRWSFDGSLFLLFLALALGSRFVLGFFRAGTMPIFGPLNGMHVQALAGLVCVAAVVSWNLTHPAESDLGQRTTTDMRPSVVVLCRHREDGPNDGEIFDAPAPQVYDRGTLLSCRPQPSQRLPL
jgi:phosphatidylglycerol:prolipoprotein diacylglycerol transferase